ncbi:hypothetical protein FISHEDRAFT_50434 [Fistulina hepatica ATCC 64428]|uniref:Uncharacterized protein n=1 Tax=Fistulina hepatica ATCC 64428 TaxID=1128425 RepID=A0A0D7A254_9AGAR|nr:hypothetical protein FISHEDRAFT_50434 [Fistulina hepatica ATCC 64428]
MATRFKITRYFLVSRLQEKHSHSKCSSDVLQSMRINVFEEDSDKVVWYKERYLGDEEIIENIVHNHTNAVCWTVHRPQRGWYVRMRSPTFPPGVFIPFTPLSSNSPYYSEAALSFRSRTNIPVEPIANFASGSLSTLHSGQSTPTVHSYPPSPTVTVIVEPPSPPIIDEQLNKIAGKQQERSDNNNRKPSAATQVTEFVLSPHSAVPIATESASLFSRALALIKKQHPAPSHSFSLTRIPTSPRDAAAPPPPYQANPAAVPFPPSVPVPAVPPLAAAPLLTFYDTTPAFTVRTLSGIIEINRVEERMLGVDTSFWVTVALTYLDFLEEREVSFSSSFAFSFLSVVIVY